MNRQPLGKVFRELIENYDVAIGFEESTFDADHDDYNFVPNLTVNGPPNVQRVGRYDAVVTWEPLFNVKKHWITINVKNGRLRDVLDAIVRQMENYEWIITDDVVNIRPKRGGDARYRELLNLRIANFKMHRDETVGMVRTKIFQLPEVKKFLKEEKIEFSFWRGYPQNAKENMIRTLPVDLDFSNLTLKELFNAVTKIKRGGWIVKRNKLIKAKGKEYIEIEI